MAGVGSPRDDTFHKAAVAGKGISIVIDDIGAKPRFHHPLREHHADGIGCQPSGPVVVSMPRAWPYSG